MVRGAQLTRSIDVQRADIQIPVVIADFASGISCALEFVPILVDKIHAVRMAATGALHQLVYRFLQLTTIRVHLEAQGIASDRQRWLLKPNVATRLHLIQRQVVAQPFRKEILPGLTGFNPACRYHHIRLGGLDFVSRDKHRAGFTRARGAL